MELIEKQLSTNLEFCGKIFKVRRDRIVLPNGNTSIRDVVESGNAVVILPVDEAGNAYLVRQYRYAQGAELLEAPAGKMEADEEPTDCALRELREETGLSAEKLINLGSIMPSPGFLTEILHLFLAVKLTQGEADPDEDEFIKVEKHSMDKLHRMILKGEITDAKTVAVYYKAADYLSGLT
jgi:ADP-ribose pyrophosphatase